MTFQELQTELFARGFADLNDAGAGLARAKRWIVEAYHDINERADWPFLEASSTGAAPLTVADLRKVIDVTNSSNDSNLTLITRGTLGDAFPDLPSSGTPEYYWIDTSTGTTRIQVYPTSTSASLTVVYYKIPADLSANGDVPVIPTRYQGAIVELAASKGYRSKDNLEQAAAAQNEGERIIAVMGQSLLDREAWDPGLEFVPAADW